MLIDVAVNVGGQAAPQIATHVDQQLSHLIVNANTRLRTFVNMGFSLKSHTQLNGQISIELLGFVACSE